jgi:hypothetical protein
MFRPRLVSGPASATNDVETQAVVERPRLAVGGDHAHVRRRYAGDRQPYVGHGVDQFRVVRGAGLGRSCPPECVRTNGRVSRTDHIPDRLPRVIEDECKSVSTGECQLGFQRRMPTRFPEANANSGSRCECQLGFQMRLRRGEDRRDHSRILVQAACVTGPHRLYGYRCRLQRRGLTAGKDGWPVRTDGRHPARMSWERSGQGPRCYHGFTGCVSSTSLYAKISSRIGPRSRRPPPDGLDG